MSRTTIRVFEYTRLRVGQSIAAVGGGTFTFSTAHFDALARFADGSDKDFIRLGHRSVRFTNYVGYLQVGELGIEVLPKADRHAHEDTGRWHDALLDMLRTAHGLRLLHPTEANLKLRRASLFDVYVARFVAEVETLLRQGLVRSYRKVQENRTAFRGRLLVSQNIRANAAAQQRMYVEHEIYDHDTIVNQTLRSALDVLGHAILPADLRNRVKRVRASLPEVVSALPNLAALDRYVHTRNTDRYRSALWMARLILEHRAPTIRAGGSPLLALLFDMNTLWERYVAVLLRRHTPPSVHMDTQDARTFWQAGKQRKTVRPDIVVRDPQGCPQLVLDTKWKVPKHGKPSDADLKQMFVYNELYDCPRSLLIYPAARSHEDSEGAFETGGHACGLRFIDLFDEAGRYSQAATVQRLRALLPREAASAKGGDE